MNTDKDNFIKTFDNLYTMYYQKVHNYLYKILGNDSAEDVTQETFVKIFKSLGTLKDESKLASWIFKIALNTARDKIRKESKMRKVEIEQKEYLLSCDEVKKINLHQMDDKNVYSVEDKMQYKEMVACYIDFVKKLPKNYYEVYVLSEFDSLSNKEISDKLSLPIETVKIRLHRARTKLYEVLRANCQCYQNDSGDLVGELKH